MRLFLLCLLLSAGACAPTDERVPDGAAVPPGPLAPALNFDASGSDARAVALADSVMRASGGMTAWDSTRYLTWNFFGARRLWWDRQADRVRVETTDGMFKAIFNPTTREGQVVRNGQPVTDPDSVRRYVERARQMWVNDAYWLVMPFKMKDPGVRLSYVGKDTTQAGQPADVVALRFDSVGYTPDNRYHVWIGQDDRLVRQWAFYGQDSQPDPDFVMPWDDYQRYGRLQLSGNRGQRHLTEIAVPATLPDTLFTAL